MVECRAVGVYMLYWCWLALGRWGSLHTPRLGCSGPGSRDALPEMQLVPVREAHKRTPRNQHPVLAKVGQSILYVVLVGTILSYGIMLQALALTPNILQTRQVRAHVAAAAPAYWLCIARKTHLAARLFGGDRRTPPSSSTLGSVQGSRITHRRPRPQRPAVCATNSNS